MRWGERYVSRLGHGSRSFSMRPFEFGRMHDHRSSWKLTVNMERYARHLHVHLMCEVQI